jgi:adenine-specific DNA-methyltransferase
MSVQSLGLQHLALHSAADVHDVFRRLGYDVYDPEPFEGDDLDQLELDEVDRETVQRAYVVARLGNHTVYLYEVADLRQTKLRGLAWNVLQRGTGLLAVTRDYREIVFVDPRFVGNPNKSSVRVNKLKVVTSDPTRHDADTLNAIHAHRRNAQQVYDAQAEAFNVATVTKRFYEEYRRHYDQARAAIRQYNPGVREFQNEAETTKLHAFTQRLLGRLMFLYFLQRKGWLGSKQKFLTEMYLNTMRQHSDEIAGDQETFYYYREVLEPLFFQTMNTKRPDNITIWNGIRIPYLNGGLFDEARDPAGPIIVPDSLFDPNSNEGVLAFFNRYNFTIAEDTPLEQDVAVDPEMLGKVFENMLEERDRGQSGSFYTPRAIVSYMCQEALAGYLEESANATRETTRAQFDPDSDVTYTAEEAERVNKALDTLTVLDPAVGSGSFLIGMMQEIIRLRRECYLVLNEQKEVTAAGLADWKEAIIRDTLYGVDIKPEAIEIAQLRLWLSLVVDQTLEQARPLPNLDYKLMAGNSLIETIDGEPVLGESAQNMLGADVTPVQPSLGMFETDRERFKLDEMRLKFFRAAPEERKRLRADISEQERRIVATSLREKAEALEQQIGALGKLSAQTGGTLKAADEKKLVTTTQKLARITTLQEDMAKPDYTPPFFLYRLHFSEVFEHKGGFDIVVANPPYVRGELLGDQKPELKLSYPDVYAGTADLYVYFYARAYDILRPKGQLSFITSNKYLRANYGKGLRKFLAEKVRLAAIIDFGDLPVFDAAAYPCIVLADKHPKPADFVPAAAVKTMEALENLYDTLTGGVKLKQSELGASEWQIAAADVQRVFAKLKAAGTPLGKYIDGKIYYGIKTGFNEAFVVDSAKRAELIAADPKTVEIIKPWLRGRDVKRWGVNSKNLYLIAIQNSGDADAKNAWGKAKNEDEARAIFKSTYPAIHNHLSQYETPLRIRQDQGRWWWELRACAYYNEFEMPKIVLPSIVGRASYGYDSEGFYSNDKTTIVISDQFFPLGLLNSTALDFFIRQIAATKQNGYFEQKPMYVSQLPIPSLPADLHDKIAALARRCLDAAKSAPEALPALEAELNALVYQAYGLDAADIAVIEESLSGKRGVELESDGGDSGDEP